MSRCCAKCLVLSCRFCPSSVFTSLCSLFSLSLSLSLSCFSRNFRQQIHLGWLCVLNGRCNWDGPNFSLEEFFFPRGIFSVPGGIFLGLFKSKDLPGGIFPSRKFFSQFFVTYFSKIQTRLSLEEFFPRGISSKTNFLAEYFPVGISSRKFLAEIFPGGIT